jgi:polygalacturonase
MKSANKMITADDGPEAAPAAVTARIQEAVDAVHAAGGGTVVLGPGRHCSGSIELKSGVELQLAHGCRLVAAGDPALFPPLAGNDPKLTANKAFGALLQARGVSDVALTGSGTIDGGGDWDEAPNWLTAQGIFRPAMGYFEGCEGLRIEGLRFVGAKWWCLHLRRCRQVLISRVSMRHNWPNSDGIDPDGCRDVIISDCHLVCGDDCIVAKSTQGDDCENILVSNCLLETPCACFKLGTESLGAFRDISVSNCVMRGNVCFALYMKDGGCMENIQAANLLMEGDADYPILIDSMPRDYRSGNAAGTIRNVRLSQVMVRGPGRAWIEGTAEGDVENIRLADIDWLVSGPLPQPRPPKPLGSARVITDPARPAHEASNAQVIAVNVRNLRLDNWSLSGPEAPVRELA